MSQERPLSIPPGLVVRLSRAKVLPGASAEADQWMAILNDRLDERVASLDRERMAIEIVFRLRENGEDYLFWVSVHGAGGISFDPDSAIDRDHLEQAGRTKETGWTEAEPQLLLLPGPVQNAVLSWALPGR
jgi:Family of unknown function (DUF6176)